MKKLWLVFIAMSARSPEFLQTHLMQTLRWMRMIGDTVFAVGAIAFVYFAIDLMWHRRTIVKVKTLAGLMVANQQTLRSNESRSVGNGVRIKTIALPAEHGGWGLLLEPIVLGLLLAPSIPGLYLAFSAIAFFLARQPLTLLILNRRRPSARTALAKRFAAIYIVSGAGFLILAMSFSPHPFLAPLLMAAPFAIVQLAHESAGHRRVLLGELAGAIAISSTAAAIALSGGRPAVESFAFWAIMIARVVPSILYVRGCLARLHRRPVSIAPILISHILAVVLVGFLFRAKLIPLLAVLAGVLLLGRAVIGFTRSEQVTPKQLGFSEIFFGALTVLAVAMGTIFKV